MRKSRSHEQSPAFQFYASDWLTNPDRLRLSLEEQGAYILLYCHCWQGFEIEYDVEVLSRTVSYTHLTLPTKRIV